MNSKIGHRLVKIRDFYCYMDFYLGRGLGIFGNIRGILSYTAYSGILVIMINQAMEGLGFGLRIAMENVFFFVPPFMVFLMLTGILDAKKLRIIQKSNEISTIHNPYLVDLIKGNKNNEK